MHRRVAALAVFASIAIVVATPTVALADAAGPTDYRSTIRSIEPAIDGLVVTIEGGDSFVRLRAPTGSEIVVFGYAGEPYLRFTSDGAVSENRLSAATYENVDRFGTAVELPEFVDNTAPPEWHQVGTNGVWSWHDHRAHWMGSEPLVGLEPGDSLPAETIPITVDGRAVAIDVVTTLIAPPSTWPAAMGALLGLQLAVFAIWLGPATSGLVTAVASAAALGVGATQFLSLPAETGPRVTWWLLPALAGLAVIAMIWLAGRSVLIRLGLLALASGELLVWALARRAALTKPVLPTDLPFSLDRALTAGVMVTAGVVLAATIWSVARIAVDPTRALHPHPNA